MIELVRHTLNQDSPEVQAVACEGVAKLMLAGMIDDETVGHPATKAIHTRKPVDVVLDSPVSSPPLLFS